MSSDLWEISLFSNFISYKMLDFLYIHVPDARLDSSADRLRVEWAQALNTSALLEMASSQQTWKWWWKLCMKFLLKTWTVLCLWRGRRGRFLMLPLKVILKNATAWMNANSRLEGRRENSFSICFILILEMWGNCFKIKLPNPKKS